MTKSISVMFASTLLAASLFGGTAAMAASDGEYFQGNSRDSIMDDDVQTGMSAPAQPLDLFSTQSIDKPSEPATSTNDDAGSAEGEYYPGVNPSE